MISIEKCKKELEKEKRRYSIEEVQNIRDILYQLARIEYDEYKRKNGGVTPKKLKLVKSIK